MPTVGQLVVNLFGNAKPFIKEVKDAQSTIRELKSTIAAVAATTAAVGTAGSAIKLAAEYESTSAAFTTMLKSGTEAKKLLADLAAFSASTPFQLPEVENAAKQLIGYGFAARDIIPTLRQLGDISAALKIPMNDLVYIYGTSSTQAHIFARDIQQLSGRGIPIIAELAKVMRVAKSDVMDLVSQGQVNFGHLQAAIGNMTSEGGQFFDTMGAASQTLEGRFSNLQDSATLSLRALGQELVKAFNLKAVIDQAIQLTSDLNKFIKDYGEQIGSVVRNLVQFGAAMTAVVVVSKTLAAAQKAVAVGLAFVKALSGPKGWLELAAGLAIATGAYFAIDHALSKVGVQASQTKDAMKLGDVAGEAKKVEAAMNGIANATASMKPDLVAVSEELARQLAQLQRIDKLRSDRFSGRNPLNMENIHDSEGPVLDRVAGLTKFGNQGKVNVELQNALRIYNQIVEANKKLQWRQVSTTGIEGEVNRLTGASDELEKIRDHIREIKEGADAVRLDKLAQLGTTPQMLAQLKEAMAAKKLAEEEKKAGEEAASAAKSLFEQTRTPLEKFEAEMDRLKKLRDGNNIDDDLFNRGVAQAEKQLRGNRKSDNNPLSAIAAGGDDAQKIILRAMGAGGNPNKQLEKNTAEMTIAIKNGNQILTQLVNHHNQPHVMTVETI